MGAISSGIFFCSDFLWRSLPRAAYAKFGAATRPSRHLSALFANLNTTTHTHNAHKTQKSTARRETLVRNSACTHHHHGLTVGDGQPSPTTHRTTDTRARPCAQHKKQITHNELNPHHAHNVQKQHTHHTDSNVQIEHSGILPGNCFNMKA